MSVIRLPELLVIVLCATLFKSKDVKLISIFVCNLLFSHYIFMSRFDMVSVGMGLGRGNFTPNKKMLLIYVSNNVTFFVRGQWFGQVLGQWRGHGVNGSVGSRGLGLHGFGWNLRWGWLGDWDLRHVLIIVSVDNGLAKGLAKSNVT